MSRSRWAGMWCAAAAAVALAGCGGPEHAGSAFTVTTLTPIVEILAGPAAHAGRTVRVEGTILRECPSGCWFEIGEGTTALYVDLAPAGLAISQKVGRTATVEGTVSLKDGRAQLLGTAVEIR